MKDPQVILFQKSFSSQVRGIKKKKKYFRGDNKD